MRNVLALVVTALMLAALPAAAQKPGQTASQFYLDYRAAWIAAKTMDPVLPYIAKESRTQVESTPSDKKQAMFEMMKTMGALTDLKIVKETKTADGYVLDMTAVGPDKRPLTGTAEIVIEDGAMKLKKEGWKE